MNIPSNKVFLYIADVRPLSDDILYKKAYSAVSEKRRHKTDKYKFKKDKLLSIGAEVLLLAALNDNGININDISFSEGQFGKPYLKSYSNIHFNLSHSGNYVLCSLSAYESGCDIEKYIDVNLKLAKYVLTDYEYKDIINIPEGINRNERFTRYWTLKESFMKAAGRGMNLTPRSFEIRLDNEVSQISEYNEQYKFFEYDVNNEYKCSLCVKGSCDAVEYKTLRLEEFLR